MTVLVPIPANGGEVYGFLVELAHVINTGGDSITVQIGEDNVRVEACYVQTSADCEGMDFILKGYDDDGNKRVWAESFSSITISSVDDVIVLYSSLFRPSLALQAA